MKTLISFFAKQNNEVSIENFKDRALSQALMSLVRGGDGADSEEGEGTSNPTFPIPGWLPEFP
jgi:hypothetical protein